MTDNKDLINAAHHRRAIRYYSNKNVTEEDLKTILEVGRFSPSSEGILNWRIVIINNPEIRQEIKECAWGAQKSLITSKHFFVFIARKDVTMSDQLVIDTFKKRPGTEDPEVLEKQLKHHDNFQKNDMQIHDKQGIFEWSSKQCYIALGMMMLAASELGLDTCPIEGFNRKKVDEILVKHKIINPEIEGATLMMSLGYRDHDPKRPQYKLSKNDFVKFYN